MRYQIAEDEFLVYDEATDSYSIEWQGMTLDLGKDEVVSEILLKHGFMEEE